MRRPLGHAGVSSLGRLGGPSARLPGRALGVQPARGTVGNRSRGRPSPCPGGACTAELGARGQHSLSRRHSSPGHADGFPPVLVHFCAVRLFACSHHAAQIVLDSGVLSKLTPACGVCYPCMIHALTQSCSPCPSVICEVMVECVSVSEASGWGAHRPVWPTSPPQWRSAQCRKDGPTGSLLREDCPPSAETPTCTWS